ncbi:MAG TPA: CBS and ACT domain-containing protein [Desulfatiglandales bacterium]|nr:CBS and ACT domain-containing protein [Desulfatiglandales bacterium]
MRTKDIMTTNVVTVNEKTSLIDAQRIMEAHRIRRLPVMKRDKLVGLVTKHKLLEVAPSPATSLSKWELNYLLDKLTVKEIMVKNPCTISPDTPVEEALRMGQEKGYGVFPVVEDGRLVGVVTESDIVRLMTEALGVTEKGTHVEIKIPHMSGNMQKILKILDQNKTNVRSLVTFNGTGDGEAFIALRLERKDTEPIAKELESSGFHISYAG